MLNENDVVAIVERFLRDAGWSIVQRSSTTQTGPDLEAVGDWEWARRALAVAGGDPARARVMVERRRSTTGKASLTRGRRATGPRALGAEIDTDGAHRLNFAHRHAA